MMQFHNNADSRQYVLCIIIEKSVFLFELSTFLHDLCTAVSTNQRQLKTIKKTNHHYQEKERAKKADYIRYTTQANRLPMN